MKPSYLLDTNVISQWWKAKPEADIVTWLEESLWLLPVPAVVELMQWVNSTSEADQLRLGKKINDFIADHPGLVMDWTAETSRVWAQLSFSKEVRSMPQPLWDSLIDAMAAQAGLIVATRNVDDFRHSRRFDPWTGELFNPGQYRSKNPPAQASA